VRWEQVGLNGLVVSGVERAHYADVLAYGHGPGGVPAAAVITPLGEVTTLELPGAAPVSWAAVSESLEFTVEQEPPVHVVGGGVGGGPFSVSGDVDVTDVVRLWPVCGDEDPQVVVADRTGRVTVVDVAAGDPPQGEGLWLVGDDLRSVPVAVGQSAVEALVAGPLRGGQQSPGVQLWVSDFYRGWVQVPLDPGPDAFTDVLSAPDPVVAGHRDRKPLLFDQTGARLDAPDSPAALLDDEHPHVCVAHRDQDRVVLALQTAHGGPQLWVGQEGRWTSHPLSPGRLKAARVTGGAHAWVVIDESLWHGSDLWS
jgi:hypothetical protein